MRDGHEGVGVESPGHHKYPVMLDVVTTLVHIEQTSFPLAILVHTTPV